MKEFKKKNNKRLRSNHHRNNEEALCMLYTVDKTRLPCRRIILLVLGPISMQAASVCS